MTKYLSLIGLLTLAACQNQGLNPDALDLNRYVTNLSESQDKFPAYVKLMTADLCGVPLSLDEFSFISPRVVPCEVKKIQGFFGDNSVNKQLYLIGNSQAELNARIFAYGLSDKDVRILEINEEQFAKDAQAQSWTDSEKGAAIEAIFKQFNSSKTIFVVNAGFAPVPSEYSVIYKSLSVPSSKVSQMKLGFVHLPELVLYAEALNEDSRKAAVLLFTFAPDQSFLGNIEAVLEARKNIIGAEDSAVEAIYRLLGNKPDIKEKMVLFAKAQGAFSAEFLMEISEMVLEHPAAFFDENLKRFDTVMEMVSEMAKNQKETADTLKAASENLDPRNDD